MNKEPVYIYLIPEHKIAIIEDLRAKIEKSATGKPYLKNSGLGHISISHSGKYFAFGMGPCNLGIDLQEHILDSRNYRQMMKRFFHEEEIQYILKGREEEFLTRFFKVWTAKESYVKYTGNGIDDNYASFSVLDLRRALQFSYVDEIDDGYTLCVCTEPTHEICIKYVD